MINYIIKEKPSFENEEYYDEFMGWHNIMAKMRQSLSDELKNTHDEEMKMMILNSYYTNVGMFANTFFNNITNIPNKENF